MKIADQMNLNDKASNRGGWLQSITRNSDNIYIAPILNEDGLVLKVTFKAVPNSGIGR